MWDNWGTLQYSDVPCSNGLVRNHLAARIAKFGGLGSGHTPSNMMRRLAALRWRSTRIEFIFGAGRLPKVVEPGWSHVEACLFRYLPTRRFCNLGCSFHSSNHVHTPNLIFLTDSDFKRTVAEKAVGLSFTPKETYLQNYRDLNAAL